MRSRRVIYQGVNGWKWRCKVCRGRDGRSKPFESRYEALEDYIDNHEESEGHKERERDHLLVERVVEHLDGGHGGHGPPGTRNTPIA